MTRVSSSSSPPRRFRSVLHTPRVFASSLPPHGLTNIQHLTSQHPPLEFLRYSHHFFRRRDSQPHLVPAVFPQTLHPVPPRRRRDLRRILVAHDQLPDFVV